MGTDLIVPTAVSRKIFVVIFPYLYGFGRTLAIVSCLVENQTGKTMARDKEKDHHYFNCREIQALNDLTALYEEGFVVRKFIINRCQTGQITYRTHADLYALIEKELGFPQPL
jgi:hypothetical protein